MNHYSKLLCCLITALSLGACSSYLSEWKKNLVGADSSVSSTRMPASSNSIEIDNRTGTDYKKSPEGPRGPRLGANSNAHMTSHNKEKSYQGYRSNQNPWSGIGAVSEGSLWRDDTQDNFYFARNMIYSVGDLLVVKIDSDINEALNSKIAGILGRSDVRQVIADEAGKAVGQEASKEASKIIKNDKVTDAIGREARDRTTASLDYNPQYIDVDTVTVRITELLQSGSYRVEGFKRVFIKKAPYNIKFSGIVRDEDISPDRSVASTQVLESRVELKK